VQESGKKKVRHLEWVSGPRKGGGIRMKAPEENLLLAVEVVHTPALPEQHRTTPQVGKCMIFRGEGKRVLLEKKG